MEHEHLYTRMCDEAHKSINQASIQLSSLWALHCIAFACYIACIDHCIHFNERRMQLQCVREINIKYGLKRGHILIQNLRWMDLEMDQPS